MILKPFGPETFTKAKHLRLYRLFETGDKKKMWHAKLGIDLLRPKLEKKTWSLMLHVNLC